METVEITPFRLLDVIKAAREYDDLAGAFLHGSPEDRETRMAVRRDHRPAYDILRKLFMSDRTGNLDGKEFPFPNRFDYANPKRLRHVKTSHEEDAISDDNRFEYSNMYRSPDVDDHNGKLAKIRKLNPTLPESVQLPFDGASIIEMRLLGDDFDA